MERICPDTKNPNVFTIYSPRLMIVIFITILFSIVLTILIPVLVIAFQNDKLPSGTIGSIFVIALIILFDLVAIGGAYKSIRNYLNPYKQIIINHEGLFLNILVNNKNYFFLPWEVISSIKLEQKYRTVGKYKHLLDCLVINYNENPQYKLPNLMATASTSGPNNIFYYSDTVNLPINEIIKKIESIKPEKIISSP